MSGLGSIFAKLGFDKINSYRFNLLETFKHDHVASILIGSAFRLSLLSACVQPWRRVRGQDVQANVWLRHAALQVAARCAGHEAQPQNRGAQPIVGAGLRSIKTRLRGNALFSGVPSFTSGNLKMIAEQKHVQK